MPAGIGPSYLRRCDMANAGIASGLARISDYFLRKADLEEFDKRKDRAEKAADERAARKEAAALKRTAGRSEGYLGSDGEGPPAIKRDRYNKEGDFLGTETGTPSEQRGYQDKLDREKKLAAIAEAKERERLEKRDYDRSIKEREVKATERRANAYANRPIVSAGKPGKPDKGPRPLDVQKRYQEIVEQAKKKGVPVREYAQSVGVNLDQFQKWMNPEGFGGGGSSSRGGNRRPAKDDADPLKLGF